MPLNQIPPPSAALVDLKSGLADQYWYDYFNGLRTSTTTTPPPTPTDPDVFRPEDYGGGPAVADNLAAFQAMATAMRTRGCGRIEFECNATYTFCVTPPAPGTIVFDLSGCSGFEVNFNGAKLVTPALYYDNVFSLSTNAGSTLALASSFVGAALGYEVISSSVIATTTISNIVGSTITLSLPATRTGAFQAAYRPGPNDGKYLYGIVLNDCTKWKINHPHFEHTNASFAQVLDPYAGLHALSIGDGCVDGEIGGSLRLVGGSIGIEVVRSNGWTEAKRSRNLRLSSDTNWSFYGTMLERNGDACEVKIKTDHVGRSGGCYGCNGNTFYVDSQGGDGFDDFLITSLSDPADTFVQSATSGIRAFYRWRPSPTAVAAKGTLIDLGFRNAVPASPQNCLLRNVKIFFDVDGTGTATTNHPGTIIQFIGAALPVSGTHFMQDIEISGTAFNMDGTTNLANVFNDVDWSSVHRRAVVFSSITAYSGGAGNFFNIDGLGLEPGVVKFRDVNSLFPIIPSNVTATHLVYDNTQFSNLPYAGSYTT